MPSFFVQNFCMGRRDKNQISGCAEIRTYPLTKVAITVTDE